ncbi:hypothetical protein [Streptomyces sp. NPDC006552]|uniref:hypothetical protein n=1 Tax=Streptomyces sp. NPDC006552 TaxID=3157179 RepID=UPI0033A9759B
MTGSNGIAAGRDGAERIDGPDTGPGRHRGAVTMSSAQEEQPEPRGRHRGPRADEA